MTGQKLALLLSFYETNCYKANETIKFDSSYDYAGLHGSDVSYFTEKRKIISPS